MALEYSFFDANGEEAGLQGDSAALEYTHAATMLYVALAAVAIRVRAASCVVQCDYIKLRKREATSLESR